MQGFPINSWIGNAMHMIKTLKGQCVICYTLKLQQRWQSTYCCIFKAGSLHGCSCCKAVKYHWPVNVHLDQDLEPCMWLKDKTVTRWLTGQIKNLFLQHKMFILSDFSNILVDIFNLFTSGFLKQNENKNKSLLQLVTASRHMEPITANLLNNSQ